jgi:putative ABC transport system permease protein
MRNKKWMVLCLLIGNILLISIAACNPMYTKAVLQRTLTKNLATYLEENNRYPATVTIRGSVTKSNVRVTNLETFQTADALIREIPDRLGLPELYTVTNFSVPSMTATPDLRRSDLGEHFSVSASFLTGLEDHIAIAAGRLFEPEPDAEGVYDVIVSQSAFVRKNLLLGEVLTLSKRSGFLEDGIRVRIAGIFTNADMEDPYWIRTPSSYSNELFFPEEVFRELFVNMEDPITSLEAVWYSILDYTAMRGDEAENMLAAVAECRGMLETSYAFTYGDSFSGTLEAYVIKANKVKTTLSVLQVPVYVLLAAFIFMVSKQMLDMERNEIAILKSRGAGKGQIIRIYLYQSLILTAVSFAAALPLGAFLCQVLGSANSFLEFVRRQSLAVEYDGQVFLYSGIAALFSVCVMVLPVFRYSDVGIVQHKQRKNTKRSETPLWQKLFLDVVLLGVSLYGLYNYNMQKAQLAERVADGASLDPLLFLSSSLFIVGAALFMLRILPAIVWLIFLIGKKLWSPGLYASYLQIIRTKRSQSFIMVFLMLTIALGIFNAQTARTINTNEEELIRYNLGADIVLKERWKNNADVVEEGEDIVYEEPDFGKYRLMEGAESVTKVLVSTGASISVERGTLKDVTVMGIHTKEFGEIAWMKKGLLPIHWYNFLNAISQNARAVLVSSNFRDKYGAELGDAFFYRNKEGASVRGIIYGFIEYWPTYSRIENVKGTDGLYSAKERFLIVAHLSQLQSAWGVTPYEVWIKAKDGDTRPIYECIEAGKIALNSFEDVNEQIVSLKNDPIFQGTSGILTVSFIVVLLLCTAGFLIYWILSIQSRALQFGIFRAMGMSVREIISMLINEQVYISGLSVAAGAGIGILASKLFIPLIQIAYASYEKSLPLAIVADAADTAKLFAVVGIVLFVCMAILSVLISRIKITQALKLGED